MNQKLFKNRIILLLLIIFCLYVTGYDYLPSPYEIIRAPMGDSMDEIEVDVSSFIPDDMVLLTFSNSGGRYRMRFTDIENDGNDELVVFYGLPDSYKCKGVIILKYDRRWTEYYVKFFTEGERYTVENARFVDITDNDYREMIIELSSFNNIKIFSIVGFENQIGKIYTFGANRIDIIYNEDASPSLAIWTEDVPGFHNIELVKWEDDGFIMSTYDTPGYFLQVMPAFENRISEDPQNNNALLYYADTIMKSGDYQNGLDIINQYIENENEPNSNNRAKAYFIKGRCQFNLGLTKEARDTLSTVEGFSDYDVETILAVKLLMVDALINLGDYDIAAQKLEHIKTFLYRFVDSDYKSHIWTYEYESRITALEEAVEQ